MPGIVTYGVGEHRIEVLGPLVLEDFVVQPARLNCGDVVEDGADARLPRRDPMDHLGVDLLKQRQRPAAGIVEGGQPPPDGGVGTHDRLQR